MRTKKMIQLISLLLFPVTIYYFSPAIIIYGILESTVAGSFMVFVLLLVTATFFNRLFCSTLCPAGAVQDLMMDMKSRPIKNKKIQRSKWVVYGLWLGIIIYLISQNGLDRVDPFYQTSYGISVTQPGGYIVLYGVLGIFMALASIFGNRGGCHTICWMSPFMIIGHKLGRLIHLPTYGLKIRSNACVSCNQCNKVCPMGLDVESMVQKAKINPTECISCSKCVHACPKDVLDMGIHS